MYVLKAGKVCQKRIESVNEKPAISRLFIYILFEKTEYALKEAREQIDQLDLFRKNLQSFVRL